MFNVSYIQLGIVAFLLLWGAGTLKSILFWLYLWQLKDYHIGRFIDHFRTSKGKRIVFLYATQFFFWRFKKPVFTAKMILLTALTVIVTGGYLVVVVGGNNSQLYILGTLVIYNLFVSCIVSAIVLLVQPFFVAARSRILQQAAVKIGKHENLTVIAVTGSYGKTTTKEFLQTILSSKFNVLATPEHKNSEIGIAQTILQDLKPEHKIFIVEMGAYNRGGIKLLCDMVKPDMGIVTGVNQQHLATFGSMEKLLSAEGGQELARHLPKHGMLVVNGDNNYCVDLYKKFTGHKRIYTSKTNTIAADLWAEQIEVTQNYVDFVLVSCQKQVAHVQLNVFGAHNIQNFLGAAMIAKELGMSLQEISAAAKNIKPALAGISLTKGSHGISIIDSSYSSNPDGVAADLDYLKVFGKPASAQGSGVAKKVVVMPCLIELGTESTRIHVELGKKIAQVCDLAIITTKDKFNELEEGFMSQGLSARKMLLCENPQEIFAVITMTCKEGDAVLLEGRVPGEVIKLLSYNT